ncbi:IS4 family transposase [Actinomadura craniellae]|uniref:IS4 family transposase n=1 Tax=Actinomadura craniellae TaxID=2231787 RepID=A0A365GUY5_9ACTN|nr:IS4 family transposase [Actinomadura craniellae]RAY10617.1 IS4 family transposase [Actinomadura craniellae]
MARIGQVKVADSDSSSVRLTDRISLGVLAEAVPRDVIEDVLDETGRREQRSRLLPAHVMVRFCVAMCLFFDDDYEEVMRKLVGSLKSMGSWRGDWRVPSTSAITQARQRLGVEPMRELFEQTAAPVAYRGTKGAWLGSWRLMSIDGFMLDVPDTEENAAEFGRKSNGVKSSAFPQVLTVALGECGSHAIVGAAIGPCNGDERALAGRLLPRLEPDMLVTADRNFYSFDLWGKFLGSGADLLWRVRANLALPVLRWLPDGSHLSMAINPKIRRSQREDLIERAKSGAEIDPDEGHLIRVVEYDVPDREGDGSGGSICVITSILDPREATAEELAAVYHERWEHEGLIDEIKTHQRGPARILRSKSPAMVYQEIWAFLLAHHGVRRLMCRAADEIGEDPDRLSFMRSLRVVRRHITGQADFSP